MSKNIAVYSLLVISWITYIAVTGCANMGQGPQGGPKDITPPKPLHFSPLPQTTNYQKNRIEIVFDELIQVDNPMQNVIVSPPQKQTPIVKAIGKKLLVELQDTLLDSTTYTIDFGSAIVDNNEKNPLLNYSFAFSTGSEIDSMKISGIVIDAATLNPVSGIMIGIHKDTTDSAFQTKPFDRITKTDKQGRFTVSNVKSGTYRVFGLEDIGNNYKFDMPNERIAFLDTVFTPSIEIKETIDTIFRDSIFEVEGGMDTIKVVDSISPQKTFIYKPDSIILKAFTEIFYKQYLVKTERPDPQHFKIYFSEKSDSLPLLEPLNFSMEQVFVQSNERKDSITYWIKDSLLWDTDTLQARLTYHKTDSLNLPKIQTDTIVFANRKNKKRNNSAKTAQVKFLSINSNIASQFDFFKEVELRFKTPTFIKKDTSINFSFSEKVDTILKPLTATIVPKDSLGLTYLLKTELKPDKSYNLQIDSAYFYDLYGSINNTYKINISTKPKDAYSTLTLEMGRHTGKEIVELLSKDDKVLRTIKVDAEKIKFELLDAGIYYARLFIDSNDNGEWDTGDYSENCQAEAVYYYPYYFELRQMWDSEEYWDYLEFPLLEQKPKELIKEKNNKK